MTTFKSAHLLDDEYQFLIPMFSSDEIKQANHFFNYLQQNPSKDKQQQDFALLDQMMTSLAGGEPVPADKHLVAPLLTRKNPLICMYFILIIITISICLWCILLTVAGSLWAMPISKIPL